MVCIVQKQLSQVYITTQHHISQTQGLTSVIAIIQVVKQHAGCGTQAACATSGKAYMETSWCKVPHELGRNPVNLLPDRSSVFKLLMFPVSAEGSAAARGPDNLQKQEGFNTEITSWLSELHLGSCACYLF